MTREQSTLSTYISLPNLHLLPFYPTTAAINPHAYFSNTQPIPTSAKMTTRAPMTGKENRRPRGLLNLPNELLTEIVSFLSVPDVRIFGRSCRQLLPLTKDYLDRYYYNTGIFVLPDKIISMIARHVRYRRPKDLSRFSRAT